MKNRFFQFFFGISLVLIILISTGLTSLFVRCKRAAAENSADTISVDASLVINNTRRRQTGINTCIFTDDDRCYFRKPVRPYDEAIKELGVKYLRYPGGYKSDVVFWSVPPYSKPNPTLVYSGPNVWPASDTTLVSKDHRWRTDMYDFDEFMTTCKNTGAEPVIVVTYNPLRWPVPPGSKPVTKEQIIENARQWVRYANVVKKYAVKYWEIGNETWLDQKPWCTKIAPEIYGGDIPEIIKAMKQEDPGIMVGANAYLEDYCKGVLSKASGSVDFISVHTYPMSGTKSYNDYLVKDPDPCLIIRDAERAIAAFPDNKSRDIKIMVTEFASGTFSTWDMEGTNLGKAIIAFDIQGQLLQDPACYFSNFWNTINIYEKENSVFNALYFDNSLTPVGKALSIWGQYLEDDMLKTRNTKYVKCFATKTEGKTLTIFALNKDTISHSVFLDIKNLKGHLFSGEEWIFLGTSLTDVHPSFLKKDDIRNLKDFTYNLPPYSIIVIRYQLGKKQMHDD